MAYRIQYETKKDVPTGGSWGRCFFFTTGFLVLFLFSVSEYWPEGWELLRKLVLPGEDGAMLQAAEVFARELGSGESVADAAGHFLRHIWEYGNPG